MPQRDRLRTFILRHPAAAQGLLAVALGVTPVVLAGAGVLSPAFVQLGAISASAAGISLTALAHGASGVRRLLRRALVWRVGPAWWLAALLLPALLAAGAVLVAGFAHDAGRRLSWSLLANLPVLFVFAGLGEEFGWRGFALPELQRGMGALPASLIVGVAHAVWHIPLFFIPGVDQQALAQQIGFWPAFLGYAVLVVALGVQAGWIFNRTGGSVLLVAVFHGAVNTWAGAIDVTSGRLAGILVYVAFNVLASAVIALRFKDPPAQPGRA